MCEQGQIHLIKTTVKMLMFIVLGLGQIVGSVSVYGHSHIESKDQFEHSVAEAVRKVLNPERIEQLEGNIAVLQRQVKVQEDRIAYLESAKLEQDKLVHELLGELNSNKRRFDSTTSIIDGSVSKDQRQDSNQASDKHDIVVSANNGTPAEQKQRTNVKRDYGAKRSIRRGDVETVAFSAYLGQYVEHLAPGYIIKCDHVILNSGNAYNAHSGVFTAPVDGIYLFDYHFDSSRHTVLALFIDGVNQLDAVTFPAAQKEGMGGNLILVDLKTGQDVWLEGRIISGGIVIGDDSFRYTTFSGVLLY